MEKSKYKQEKKKLKKEYKTQKKELKKQKKAEHKKEKEQKKLDKNNQEITTQLNNISQGNYKDETIAFSAFANPNKRKELHLPRYSKGEELFNAISHIVGAFLGIIGGIFGVYYGYKYQGYPGLFTMLFYAFTTVFLYTMSSIYHFLFVNKAKKVFQVMDHCTIFVLIMGTYTPICVMNLNNIFPYNFILLGSVYLLGILGIVLNATMMEKLPVKIVSNTLYLVIGWLIIFFYAFLKETISFNGLMLILFGGISYSLGAILYAIGSKRKYFHSIFHIFVLIGSILQYLGILLYAIIGL